MSIVRLVFKNLIVFMVGYILKCAELSSIVSPFFVAFCFAINFIEDDIVGYIFGVFLANITYELNLFSVLQAINVVAVMALVKLISKKTKKSFIFNATGVVLANIINLFMVVSNAETLVVYVINLVLVVAFMYSYIMFFRAINIRGTATRYAMDELLGFALLLTPFVMVFNKWGVAQFFVPILLFVSSNLYGGTEMLAFAVISGVGIGFSELSIQYVAIYCLYAIGIMAVKRLGKVTQVLTIIVIDCIIGYFFLTYGDYGVTNLIPILLAGFVYILIPKKVWRRLSSLVYNKQEDVCLNEVVVQEKMALKDKLKRVSRLFKEMHTIYKNMVIGRLDSEQVEEMIRSDLVRENCINCPKYKYCYEGRGLTSRSISDLIKRGMGKKSVTLVDLPTILVSTCGKTNQMIFQLNNRLDEYFEYERELNAEDDGKILISNQLLGVGELIEEFGTDFEFGIRANKEVEQSLTESFLYNDIIVKECAIFYENNIMKRTVIVIKNDGYKSVEILNVLNTFFKIKTQILDVKFAKYSGWQIMSISLAPKYTFITGVASTAKNKISGDKFGQVNIDNKRAVFILSDGKGCGSQASKISEMTINLTENFFKAGFKTEHIMDNVNKVMAYKSGENFSAVDVCVLDLELAEVDFVKRGGTPSVIKKSKEVQVIEGQALPIGMLEHSQNAVERRFVSGGDVIVLASDGVFDAFNSSEKFAGFINNIPAVNVQELANNILSKAINLNKGQIFDDMTVFAIKVILNR